MSEARITPVILCGGSGTRLWPLSRAARPKQMLALAGPDSLLRQTVARVGDPQVFAAPVAVGAAAQADAIAREVEQLGALILEPAQRNTAPAIALAALNAAGDDVLLVLPSDHLIADAEGFREAVRRALPFAREGWIVTFGMAPDRPETGYGYIRRGAAIGDGVFAAERFVEKPDAETAVRYLADGGYDWNGGIFLLRADVAIEGLRTHAPEILAAAREAFDRAARDGVRIVPEAAAFRAAPSQSIDYALMEKAGKVAVMPVSIGWSDIGSWDALHDRLPHDEDGNAIAGDVVALDVRGCLIRSDGPVIAAIGVNDLVIVATADAVLVVPRDQAQRVKEIVDALGKDGRGSLI
jgi:mannose-1-phosphate guanylyltransferase/mannose-1-phosphate guanylyltransferase/mannose-6-phosphate isomerase